MTDTRQTNDLLDAISKVLLRCVFLGFGLLIIWAAVYFAAGDLLFRLNSSTKEELGEIEAPRRLSGEREKLFCSPVAGTPTSLTCQSPAKTPSSMLSLFQAQVESIWRYHGRNVCW